METIIKVKGMKCNGCENRIQNVIKKVEGVEEVIADYQKGLVTINANTEIDKNTFYEKIEDLGFEVEKED